MKTALITVIVVIAVLILITLLICGFIFSYLICTKPVSLPAFVVRTVESFMAGNEMPDSYDADAAVAEQKLKSLPFESVTLKADNSERIKGHILHPDNPNGCVVIACHGARSSAMGEFCFMIPHLYKLGYTLVLPEHRGCGISDGKYMGYGTHESEDGMRWLDYTQNNFKNYDVFLLGVSMGAATVLMMSNKVKDTNVRGIIADCSYTSAWDELSYQLKTSFHLPAFPLLYICDLYCRLFAHYSFKDASPVDCVKKSSVPTLFIHGENDDFVPYYMQKILYDRCSAPKDILSVSGAVHARSCYTAPELYINKINNFMMKYSKTAFNSSVGF